MIHDGPGVRARKTMTVRFREHNKEMRIQGGVSRSKGRIQQKYFVSDLTLVDLEKQFVLRSDFKTFDRAQEQGGG